MKGFSLTQTGNYVALVATILGVTTDELNGFVTVSALVLGIIVSFIGRLRKGDINLLGFRK